MAAKFGLKLDSTQSVRPKKRPYFFLGSRSGCVSHLLDNDILQTNHTLSQAVTQKVHPVLLQKHKVDCLQSLKQLLQCLHMSLQCPGMYNQVVNVVYYIVHAIEEFPHCPRHCHTGIQHPKWHSQVLVMLTHCHKGGFMYICRTSPYLVKVTCPSSCQGRSQQGKEPAVGQWWWFSLNAQSQHKYDYPCPSLQPPAKSRVNCSFGWYPFPPSAAAFSFNDACIACSTGYSVCQTGTSDVRSIRCSARFVSPGQSEKMSLYCDVSDCTSWTYSIDTPDPNFRSVTDSFGPHTPISGRSSALGVSADESSVPWTLESGSTTKRLYSSGDQLGLLA